MNLKHYSMYLVLSFGLLITSGCATESAHNQPDSSKPNTSSSIEITQNSNTQSVEQMKQYTTEIAEAQKLFSDGDYPGAIAAAQLVVDKSPQNDQAYSLKGFALALNGDTSQGLDMTKKAYELNPQNVGNFYNMAMVYKLMGQLNESKGWFDKVLEKDPNNTWSVYGIATIYADQQQDKEALKWLGRAIKIDPAVKDVARTQDHFERFHGREAFENLVAP